MAKKCWLQTVFFPHSVSFKFVNMQLNPIELENL